MLLTIFLVLGIGFLLIKLVPLVLDFFEDVWYQKYSEKTRKRLEEEEKQRAYEMFQAPFRAIDEELKKIGKAETKETKD